jgi:hypothetical protein
MQGEPQEQQRHRRLPDPEQPELPSDTPMEELEWRALWRWHRSVIARA